MKTWRCDDCGEPIAGCDCPPKGEGEPEEEDLVTEDHVHFYEHGGTSRRPVVTVKEGRDWRAAVLTWMVKNKFYPNVWLISDHGNSVLLDLGGGDEEEGC